MGLLRTNPLAVVALSKPDHSFTEKCERTQAFRHDSSRCPKIRLH